MNTYRSHVILHLDLKDYLQIITLSVLYCKQWWLASTIDRKQILSRNHPSYPLACFRNPLPIVLRKNLFNL